MPCLLGPVIMIKMYKKSGYQCTWVSKWQGAQKRQISESETESESESESKVNRGNNDPEPLAAQHVIIWPN